MLTQHVLVYIRRDWTGERIFEALPRQTLTFADLILLQGSKHPWKYRYQPNTVMTDFWVS